MFRCSNKNEHIQKLTLKIVLRHGEAFIVKISQDPINNVLVENESKIYINQLKRFGAIEDFRNAQASKSRNLYAGAITYLRRIFEKMINYYIDIEKPNIKANDHVKVKIDSISEYLDKDFLEIANPIYSLMSKGIHELSDLEIDEFYNLLYAAIMFQLYHQKEIDDGQAARKEIKAGISSHLEKHK